MRRDRRKDLYRRERDSLEGPHEEAEIQHKALRRGKNLAFSEDTCLEKERVRSKVTPRKVGVGLKRRRELNKRKPTPCGEEQLGKLGKEEDEKEDPGTERRKEYTDIGLDLGEREEQVASHASALAMTNEVTSTQTSAPIKTELLVWPPPP